MSHITNVILSHNITEREELIEKINKWLEKEHGRDRKLVKSEEIVEIPTYLMEYNHLFIEEFLTYVFSLPWESTEDVQVFLCEQYANKYTLYDMTNYKEYK